MSSVANRLIKGSAWISMSRAIVNLLTAANTFILAWFLTPADFGLVAIATTLTLILSSITELSLTQALINHKAPTETHLSAAWTMTALRGILLGGLFAASAYPIAAFYEDERLAGIILTLSVGMAISGLVNPRPVMMQRNLVFWQDFVLNVSQKLAGLLATLTAAVLTHSYWALVVGVLTYQVTGVIVSYAILPFRPRPTFRHLRELFSFSIWLTLGQAVNMLNWRVEYLIIGKMLGAAPLGNYTIGSTLAGIPTREATAPLTATIFPGFAAVRGDVGRLRAAYQRAQALLTAIALPAGIGMAVVADPLIRCAMGERWAGAIFIVQALAAVYAVQTLGSLVQPLGMALGHTKLLFYRDSQMLCARLPIIIAGLILGGLPGAVYARVFTGLLATLVNMILVRRLIEIDLREQLRVNVRAIVSVGLMALMVSLFLNLLDPTKDRLVLGLHLIGASVVGAATYAVASFALWTLANRPDGPETEIMRVARNLMLKAAAKLARRPART